MKQIVRITNRNIREGERANPQNCAIARAIKSQVKKAKEVSVVGSHITLSVDNKMFVAKMPKIGENFIKKFDHGLAVGPFKLNLRFKKGFCLV